ncbi:hypothetical protein SAMN05443579_11620 [Variovorax sp. PDC80]|uniref:hypothetical protein n=1 Tax=Variovorax sp. PDC80 TaxID=1882827 RepID=UPI0008E27566|nr:hypothetical protein [Variovorax sp. PDC80]SFP83038.1 hypothetical protein SAMN05443579_11620 [Variovorax sp. PDC80]
MAESVCACAQSSDPSTFVRLTSLDLSTLALQTCDDADHLNEVLRAYTALEKLVEPAGLQDCETLTPSRTELSALLCLLNRALRSRIDTIHAAAITLHEAIEEAVQPPTPAIGAP